MDTVMLPPPECLYNLRKGGLDTRLFTSLLAVELTEGAQPPGQVELRLSRSYRFGHSGYSGDSFTGFHIIDSHLNLAIVNVIAGFLLFA